MNHLYCASRVKTTVHTDATVDIVSGGGNRFQCLLGIPCYGSDVNLQPSINSPYSKTDYQKNTRQNGETLQVRVGNKGV